MTSSCSLDIWCWAGRDLASSWMWRRCAIHSPTASLLTRLENFPYLDLFRKFWKTIFQWLCHPSQTLVSSVPQGCAGGRGGSGNGGGELLVNHYVNLYCNGYVISCTRLSVLFCFSVVIWIYLKLISYWFWSIFTDEVFFLPYLIKILNECHLNYLILILSYFKPS